MRPIDAARTALDGDLKLRKYNSKVVGTKGKRKAAVARKEPARVVDLTSLTNSQIVVFPEKEHMRKFSRVSKKMEKKGPAEHNPGAIGTIGLYTNGSIGIGGVVHNVVIMQFTQSHGGTSAGMRRGLLTKYAGWRHLGIREAIGIAGKLRKPLGIDSNTLGDGAGLRRDIISAAREASAKTTRLRNGGMVIFPKQEQD